jgi:membrane associated rhomboid family serine protease
VIPIKDENPTRHAPVATVAIILACAAIYLFWQPSPFSETGADTVFTVEHAAIPCEIREQRPLTIDELRATYDRFGRVDACGAGSPESPQAFPGKSVWLSVLVSMFLHGSVLHVAGNLLFLWIFGNNIEDHLGPLRFVAFYVAGGVVATLTHVALNLGSTVPMVGASGAIAAVMGAYMVWFPDAPVRTVLAFFFITIVRIRAKWVLGFWFVLQFFTSPNSGVAWAAHVGGFVFGAATALAVRASPGLQRLLWRRSARLSRTTRWDPTGGAGYAWFDR